MLRYWIPCSQQQPPFGRSRLCQPAAPCDNGHALHKMQQHWGMSAAFGFQACPLCECVGCLCKHVCWRCSQQPCQHVCLCGGFASAFISHCWFGHTIATTKHASMCCCAFCGSQVLLCLCTVAVLHIQVQPTHHLAFVLVCWLVLSITKYTSFAEASAAVEHVCICIMPVPQPLANTQKTHSTALPVLLLLHPIMLK